MFRDRKPTRGVIPKARSTYATFGAKFQGPGGVGPWPKGKRVVDSAYNNTKKKLKEQKPGTKAATEDVNTYRQKMMITPEPLRKYVDKEVEKIKEALLEALEPLEDGYFPQFYGVSYSKGALVMSCANEPTKRWLEKIIPELKPWEGAKLRVKPKGEVAEGTKVQIKTPKLFAKSDPKKILQMLSTQNKTLDTSNWKNVSMTSDDSGQTLVYIVDNSSLDAIRALNGKVYLGLGNVEVVILNNEEDEKQTSVDTEMENEEESDKPTSEETDEKNEETDKKTSVDTEMKNEEEGVKETSADTEIKNEKEADK